MILTIGIACATLPFAVYVLRRRALARRVYDWRQPTQEERQHLRRYSRRSLVAFVAFWIVSIGLVVLAAARNASPIVAWAALVPILLVAAVNLGYQLRTVCPICSYPLGYQKPLRVPNRCERCGATL